MADIEYGQQLHTALRSGSRQLADVIRHNYGPTGRNTILDQKYDLPLIATSGRKVLTDFSLEDKFESVGAELIRDAALKIGKEHGDGTIACAILTDALLNEGCQMIAAGYNPMLLRSGALTALNQAVAALDAIKIPCDERMLHQAAARIARSEALGDLAIQAYNAVGYDGTITVLDSQSRDTELHTWNGVRYEYGLYAREFVEQEATKSVEFHNPHILLVNYRIKDIAEIGNVVVQASQNRVPLLMIVADMDDSVKQILAANVAQKRVRLAVAKAPGHGDTRRRNLFCLSAKTGAAVFEENGVRKLSDAGLESCGIVEYAKVDMESTLLKGFPLESSEMVETLMGLVRKLLAETTADYEVEKLEESRAILMGKTAEIVAGGVTEYEMFERKYLLENTVQAVRSIARSGIVPGGGKSWLIASKALDNFGNGMNEEEKQGLRCLQRALLRPMRQLVDNSGADGSPVVQQMLKAENVWLGYDATDGTITDLKGHGIVDSVETATEILRTAVETATSLWTAAAAVIG